MAKRIQVGGRIESKEVGGIVTGAADILDDAKGKKQSVINGETDDELLRLDQSKQDNLTFDNAPTEGSDNPVKSGGVYVAEKALSDAIEAIMLLIPSAASALNKLVDTAMMNSSISTATATFKGTYNVITDLSLTIDATHEQIAAALGNAISTADNNDYAFVQVPVSAESMDIRRTERYKYNGTAWGYEYDLNTSGFTVAQWAAINSGITIALVGKLIGLPTSSELQELLGQKQNTLTFDNLPTAGSANPVKSGGVYSSINDEKTAREQLANTVTGIEGRVGDVEEVIPTGAAANNKLVANNSMEAYVTRIIDAITASFTIATDDGHINLTLTQTNGRVASLTLTSSDIASAQALTALTGRVSTAEGNITSLNGRVSTNETDIANLQQLYNNLQQSKPVPVTTLPTSGQQQGVIYRLAGTTSYSDYMWNGSTWVLMATYNNAIDDEPTAGSNNLVKSGGVYQLGIIPKDVPLLIGAIANTGETDDDENWVKTDYMETPIGRIFNINLLSVSGIRSINLYDVSKNLIAYDSRSFNEEEWVNNDANVRYARFCGKSASYGSYTPSVIIENYSIKTELIELQNQVNEIKETTTDTVSQVDMINDVLKFNGYNQIVQSCQDVVAYCMRRTNNNILVMLPDANGSYSAFWVRDFAMALDGNINLKPTDILAAYNLIKSTVTTSGDKAYWIPDHIMLDGTPIWRPGSYEETGGWGYRASLDGAGFLVKIADYYVRATNDILFINDNIDFLFNAINSLLTNNLVNIVQGQESCVFGFYDSVKFNGAIAYNTIQCYESLKILKRWAEIAGLSRAYPIEAIKDAFNNTFVVIANKSWINSSSVSFDTMDYAYVKSSTGLNSGRFDVWATAYAIQCGILTSKNEILCCIGIEKFYNEIIKNGQAKHVPTSFYYSQTAMWESYFDEPALGTYQNGGYWLTPICDIILSLKKVNVSLSEQLYKEALKYCVQTDFCEYSDENGQKHKGWYATSASAISQIIQTTN